MANQYLYIPKSFLNTAASECKNELHIPEHFILRSIL